MPKFILTLFFLLTTSLIWSQSDAQRKLEERKEQLQKEIAEARTALNSEKKKAKTILESENSKQSEIDEEVARLSSVIEVYEKSRVESTAVSEIKQEVSISVKDNTIICNVPFQIIAIGGQNVTSQNGALLSGTYIVVTEQENKKVIVK